MLKVHGVMLSPFVRKVLLALEHKGLAYENTPVFPGSDDPAFRAISPLGKIPVLEDGAFSVPDTSVICRYLERLQPEPALYPSDARAEARACWLEEFADSKLMDALGGLFQQRFVRPRLQGMDPDAATVAEILDERLPPLLDYLESCIDGTGPLIGAAMSIADLSVLTCFMQGHLADYQVDADRYPKLAAWLQSSLALPLFTERARHEAEFIAAMASA